MVVSGRCLVGRQTRPGSISQPHSYSCSVILLQGVVSDLNPPLTAHQEPSGSVRAVGDSTVELGSGYLRPDVSVDLMVATCSGRVKWLLFETKIHQEASMMSSLSSRWRVGGPGRD
jgi:hypothetical protein